MNKTPYVRFYWSDWIADTSHLDLMQLGAYMRLLEHVYQHGRPLPGNMEKLFRICHATSPTEQTAIRGILTEYFVPFDDSEHGPQWRHLRAEREMEWASKSHQAKVDGGRLGARRRWESQDGDGSPNGSPNGSPIGSANGSPCSNQNQNQKEILADLQSAERAEKDKPDKSATTQGFDRFWTAYPRKVAKQQAAKAWAAGKLDSLATLIVADVTRRRLDDSQWSDPQYIPHPTTYIRQRRWEDEITAVSKPAPAERLRLADILAESDLHAQH